MKKLKPFDLEAALKGEPVMLRGGNKAFVRHYETELKVHIEETLLGYIEGRGVWAWRVNGTFISTGDECQYDIIGMYPKTRAINGFEVPAPETEAPTIGSTYFFANCAVMEFFELNIWRNDKIDKLWLERGLVFLNNEDAIANAKAMLGIDPNKPSMD